MKAKINVKGMHCKSCEVLLTDSLEEIGVKAKVSASKGLVEVEYDDTKVSLEKIKSAIKKEGYEA